MKCRGARVEFFTGVILASLVLGCGDPGGDLAPPRHSPLIYGDDDRKEYFEFEANAVRAAGAAATVALVSKSRFAEGASASWAQSAGVCANERFSDQPAVAFCTGILVDWDLILTAGHCARAFSVGEISAVFGFFYDTPGADVFGSAKAVPIREVVSPPQDRPRKDGRLDFAWFRLDKPVPAGVRPAAIHIAPPHLNEGDAVTTVGANHGLPLKWDAGGVVRMIRRETADYFVTDSDTSAGSSGAPVFDAQGAVLGVLARGGPDLFKTDDGCKASVMWPAGSPQAQEEVTYAHRAIEGLCAAEPENPLCDKTCGSPCHVGPRPVSAGTGCALAPGSDRRALPRGSLILFVAASVAFARRNRASKRTGPRR